MSVTRGAIAKIISMGGNIPEDSGFFAILEVIDIKNVPDGKTGRIAFTVSDGTEIMKAVVSTQNAEKMQTDLICPSSLIKVSSCMINDMPPNAQGISTGKMMIILDGEYLGGGSAPGGNRKVDSPHLNMHSNNSYGHNAHTTSPQSNYGINSINSAVNTPINAYAQPYGNNAQNQSAYASTNQGNNAYQSYGGNNASSAYSAPSAYGGSANSNPAGAYSGYANNRPVVRDGGDLGIVPISALNPYSTKWTIKARVTAKSDIRKFNNAKGDGCLFSLDLLDAHGGEIRGTFFGPTCCDKFYNLLASNQVFFFSGGKLKIANKKYCQLKNEYEITFDERSEVREAPDDVSISKMTYEFIKLSELAAKAKDDTVDVLGVVKSFSDVTALNSVKLGKEVFKREVYIIDDSNTECRVTLWGEKAQQDPGWATNPIVAFKRAAVDDYNGRALKTASSTSFQLNPDIPEARQLHQWAQAAGRGDLSSIQTTSLMGAGAGSSRDTGIFNRKTIDYIHESGVGHSEKGDYFTTKATVSYVNQKNDPWYPACEKCNKKVIETPTGAFVCDKCQVEYEKPKFRYILNTSMCDETGSTYFTFFDEQASMMLGQSADDMYRLKLSEEHVYEQQLNRALFKQFIFTARAKYDTIKDEQRLKCTVISASAVDFVSESGQLLEAIRKYETM